MLSTGGASGIVKRETVTSVFGTLPGSSRNVCSKRASGVGAASLAAGTRTSCSIEIVSGFKLGKLKGNDKPDTS